jgi:hypothetical protein
VYKDVKGGSWRRTTPKESYLLLLYSISYEVEDSSLDLRVELSQSSLIGSQDVHLVGLHTPFSLKPSFSTTPLACAFAFFSCVCLALPCTFAFPTYRGLALLLYSRGYHSGNWFVTSRKVLHVWSRSSNLYPKTIHSLPYRSPQTIRIYHLL